jgi:acetyl esterase
LSETEQTTNLTVAPRLTAQTNLDPSARLFLAGLRAVGWPPTHERTIGQARRDFRTLAAATSGWRPMAHVDDALVHADGRDIPVRVYRPLHRSSPSPLLVWLHGGGFVIGDLFTADGTCRRLADACGAVVVSVDYRRAPEHPLPAAHEDAVAATVWAIDHCAELGGNPARIVVGGDSAGANLAAHTVQMLRDHGPQRAAMQLLVYPVTDLSLSHTDFDPRLAQLLTHKTLHWFGNHAMPNLTLAERRRADISPMFADELDGLPPAMLITAEIDPLRSDGTAYLRRLRAAGVPVTHANYPGQIHGFFAMDLIMPASSHAIAAAARAISTVHRVALPTHDADTAAVDWQTPSAEWQRRIVETTRRIPMVNAIPMMSTLLEHHMHTAATALRRKRRRGSPPKCLSTSVEP